MYQQGFIVSIRNDQGEVLRESNGHEVFLPFDTDYSIRLKNNHNSRAVAEIFVDGTKILGEHRIIIEPYSHTDVERFCIDGNLGNGKKLRFVRLSDGRVQDPTSGENGIVRVKFWLEKEKPVLRILSTNDYEPYAGSINRCETKKCAPNVSYSFCSSTQEYGRQITNETKGATVEGSFSGQSFQEDYVGEIESYATEITLYLRASKSSVTVKDTRFKYCSRCGSKAKSSANFCGDCGIKF